MLKPAYPPLKGTSRQKEILECGLKPQKAAARSSLLIDPEKDSEEDGHTEVSYGRLEAILIARYNDCIYDTAMADSIMRQLLKIKEQRDKKRADAAAAAREKAKPCVLLIPSFDSYEKWVEIAEKQQAELVGEADEY